MMREGPAERPKNAFVFVSGGRSCVTQHCQKHMLPAQPAALTNNVTLTYPTLPYPTLGYPTHTLPYPTLHFSCSGRFAARPQSNNVRPLRHLFPDPGLRFSCFLDAPTLPYPTLGLEENPYPTLTCPALPYPTPGRCAAHPTPNTIGLLRHSFFRPRVACFLLSERSYPALPYPEVGGEPLHYPTLPRPPQPSLVCCANLLPDKGCVFLALGRPCPTPPCPRRGDPGCCVIPTGPRAGSTGNRTHGLCPKGESCH